MKVKVLFFGVLAEKAGMDNMLLEGAADLDRAERLVLERHPGLRDYTYRISVNKSIVNTNIELHDGDELALLPPFAGG